MDQDTFAGRLTASAESARALARTLVSEDLPASMIFRVRLNQSYDGHPPRPGEVRYPLDSLRNHHAGLRRCDFGVVLEELWRDGHVPEWINVAVVGETGTATVIELVCSGRFTDDDSRLYHSREGVAPFHVLGPAPPPQPDTSLFSIHSRTECWDAADLAHLATVADRVWSLTLQTDEFDEDALAALPFLPNTEVVEHRCCALGGEALSAFGGLPRLRALRLTVTGTADFSVDPPTRPTGATTLEITNLPARPWGFASLVDSAPAVTAVALAAGDTLWLDGTFSPEVRNLSLGAGRITGGPRLPAHLDHLSVRVGSCSDGEIAALLEGVDSIRSLSLRGTPVTDALVHDVVHRFGGLDRLDVVGTAVTAPMLARLAGDRPNLSLLPDQHNRPNEYAPYLRHNNEL